MPQSIQVDEEEEEEREEPKGNDTYTLKNVVSFLFIILSVVAFIPLISRAAVYSNETPLKVVKNATSLALDFQEATPEEINGFLLVYWYDNMFTAAWGLCIAALINAVLLPKYVKLALYFISIPGHTISDWIENTAGFMTYISFSGSEDKVVDQYWITQYYVWSYIKYTLLAINVLSIIVGFALSLRKRFCS